MPVPYKKPREERVRHRAGVSSRTSTASRTSTLLAQSGRVGSSPVPYTSLGAAYVTAHGRPGHTFRCPGG